MTAKSSADLRQCGVENQQSRTETFAIIKEMGRRESPCQSHDIGLGQDIIRFATTLEVFNGVLLKSVTSREPEAMKVASRVRETRAGLKNNLIPP